MVKLLVVEEEVVIVVVTVEDEEAVEMDVVVIVVEETLNVHHPLKDTSAKNVNVHRRIRVVAIMKTQVIAAIMDLTMVGLLRTN